MAGPAPVPTSATHGSRSCRQRRSRPSSPGQVLPSLRCREPATAARWAKHALMSGNTRSWGGSVKLRASRKVWLTRVLPITAVAAAVAGGILAITPTASASVRFEVESLDGNGNNVANSSWGQAGKPYARVGTAHYADGIGRPVSGPNARYISNRIINDGNQDVFSQRRLTQFTWQFGQ